MNSAMRLRSIQGCFGAAARRPRETYWSRTSSSLTRATRSSRTTSHIAVPMLQAVKEWPSSSSPECLRILGSHTNFRHEGLEQNYFQWAWLGLGFATAMTMSTLSTPTKMTTTSCETATNENDTPNKDPATESGNENNNTPPENKNDDQQYEIGPDDPYYNIPEKDEPTDCSMCLTFRQGPCRLEWKRFELCVKDKEDAKKAQQPQKDEQGGDGDDATAAAAESPPPELTSDDQTACMKYAMPFYMCSSKYVNTYMLLSSDQTNKIVIQPLLDNYSTEEAKASRRLCLASQPSMDWSNWETFVETLVSVGGKVPTRFKLSKTGFESPVEALKATWKDPKGNQYLMMNEEGEPFLITTTARIPKRIAASSSSSDDDKDSGDALFMTFALDQRGNLLGDARYSEEQDQKHETDDQNDTETAPTAPSSDVELVIQIVPGVTEKFTIYCLYVPKDGDFLEEGTLYESKPYSIQSVTKKTTKRARKLAKQKSSPEKAAEKEA